MVDISSIHTYRGTHVSCDRSCNFNLLEALYCHLRERPNSIFLTEVSEKLEQRDYTYQQLDIYSRRAMAWLKQEYYFSPGQVLALAPKNNFTSIAVILGAIRSGIAIALLNREDPPLRNAEICDALDAKIFISSFPLLENLPAPIMYDVNLNYSADAFYFVTSGSTAASKIVAQTHQGATANALALIAHHDLTPDTRLLGCLPINHVNGFHLSFLSTLFCGSHVILMDRFDPFHYPIILKKNRPKIASVTPSILEALLVTWRANNFPDDFGYFISAASPLNRQTAANVWNRWRIKIVQGYGLSETNNFSTTLPVNLSDEAYQRLMIDAQTPSIGVALHGNEVAILSAAGKPVSEGEVGEICIRGFNVMARYVNNEQATADAFRDGWLHSGDLGFEHFDAEVGSAFFTVTGRIKNIAKIRGQAVSLEAMENKLLSIFAICDAACSTIEDNLEGEIIVALIVAGSDISNIEIINELKLYFSEVLLPRHIIRRESIPRTATGKILRPQLRALIREAINS
jgi:acyl-CoA synthetase (AMP-forming)/AMP-acid ligase II